MHIKEMFNIYRENLTQLSAFLAVLINPKNIIKVNTIRIDDKYPFPANRNSFDGIREDFVEFTKVAVIKRIIEDVDVLFINLYHIILDIAMIYKSNNEKRKFSGLPFDIKLNKIDAVLNGALKNNKDLWKNLHDVRNDLVHNNSIVKQEKITLNIPKVYSYVVIDCEKIWIPYFDNGKISDIDMSKMTEYHMELQSYTKTFHKGETITFSNSDIKFLLSGLDWSIYEIDRILTEFMICNEYYILEEDTYILNIQKLKEYKKFKEETSNK